MYKATKTRVKTHCGLTQYFNIEVGLHQGSTLSPLLFIITMDVSTSSIQRDPPWAMLFADDLVICEESRLEVKQQLDSWREVLEENHSIAYDRVPRDLIWWALRKKNIPEAYITIIQYYV